MELPLVNIAIRTSVAGPASLTGGAPSVPRRAAAVFQAANRHGGRCYGGGVLAMLCVALVVAPVRAANTEPTLALMRATAARSTSGRVTVTLEGSFSFADTVQLQLPLQVR